MGGRDVVVLVDESGTVVGQAPKLAVHEPPGQLHLALSVVLYRPDATMLLQQRAGSKYHFSHLWANACCSHPGPGEEIIVSAVRRVEEELGVRCALRPAGSFIYRAECAESGLVEYELDHVFVGVVEGELSSDPDEVEALRWVDTPTLMALYDSGVTVPWLAEVVRLAERAGAGAF